MPDNNSKRFNEELARLNGAMGELSSSLSEGAAAMSSGTESFCHASESLRHRVKGYLEDLRHRSEALRHRCSASMGGPSAQSFTPAHDKSQCIRRDAEIAAAVLDSSYEDKLEAIRTMHGSQGEVTICPCPTSCIIS